jgi:hypothetical protein
MGRAWTIFSWAGPKGRHPAPDEDLDEAWRADWRSVRRTVPQDELVSALFVSCTPKAG